MNKIRYKTTPAYVFSILERPLDSLGFAIHPVDVAVVVRDGLDIAQLIDGQHHVGRVVLTEHHAAHRRLLTEQQE